MKNNLIRDEKKLDADTVNERKKTLTQIARELQELCQQNGSESVSIKPSATLQILQARREKSEKKHRARKFKKREESKSIEDKDVAVEVSLEMTSDEKQFMQDVDEVKRQQDEMLTELLQGVNQLHQLATDMNVNLNIQQKSIETNLEPMVSHITHKQTQLNQRMRMLFEETGGLSRYVPLCFCILLLMGLVGFFIKSL